MFYNVLTVLAHKTNAKGAVLVEQRENDVKEMTNEEYKDMIFDMVSGIDNNMFLKFICNFIKSAIKKWL